MCGVTTNVVTAVEATDAHANDHNYFKPLVEAQSMFELGLKPKFWQVAA